jgi:hypothetical protein
MDRRGPLSMGKGKRNAEEIEETGRYEPHVTRTWVKNHLDDSDTCKDREALRNAIMAVYAGATYTQAEAEVYGWSVKFVTSLVERSMPLGLEDHDNSFELMRAASLVAGVNVGPRCWSDQEARACLHTALTTTKTNAELLRKYGLGKSTFHSLMNKLTAANPDIKNASASEKLRMVNALELPRPGVKPMFSRQEMLLIFTAAGAMKTLGCGVTEATLGARCRETVRTNAAQFAGGSSGRLAQMEKAVCGKTWMARQKKLYGPEAGISAKSAKTSKKSLKRAQVSFILVNCIDFAAFYAAFGLDFAAFYVITMESPITFPAGQGP